MDEIEIQVPSGKTVTIRNYTTRKDDMKAEEALYVGVNTTSDDNGKTKMEFPIANVMASTAVYVRRLVKEIEGDNKNIAYQLEELRSDDYLAIEEAVEKVVDENSPKAKKTKEE